MAYPVAEWTIIACRHDVWLVPTTMSQDGSRPISVTLPRKRNLLIAVEHAQRCHGSFPSAYFFVLRE